MIKQALFRHKISSAYRDIYYPECETAKLICGLCRMPYLTIEEINLVRRLDIKVLIAGQDNQQVLNEVAEYTQQYFEGLKK